MRATALTLTIVFALFALLCGRFCIASALASAACCLWPDADEDVLEAVDCTLEAEDER